MIKKILASTFLIVVFFQINTKIIKALSGEGQCCSGTYPACDASQNLVCDQYSGSPSACAPGNLVCRKITTQNPKYNLPKYGVNGIPTILFSGALGKESIAPVINEALRYVFAISGLLLFFYLLYGAFQFVSSMGNPAGVAAGSTVMTRALIGFAIIFSTYWLIQILEIVLDINII